MAQHEFRLKHGLTFGKGDDAELQYDVTLRELGAGDLIDARLESERVLATEDGPRLVLSPETVALNILRRQIKQIGKLQGPMSITQLKSLHLEDYDRLVDEASALDAAVFAERLSDRGRTDKAPGQD